MLVPKLIHQTWKTSEVPARFVDYQASWRRYHPDWEYRLWTDADNEQLVRERYPDLLQFYLNLPFPILKVEIAKILYLDCFGGLYVDLDFEALRPIDDLLTGRSVVMGRETGGLGGYVRGRDYIMNAFIWSTTGHPFWKQTLDAVVKRFRRKRFWKLYEYYIVEQVIGVIDDLAESHRRRHDDLTICDYQMLYPSPQSERNAERRRSIARRLGSYAVHHYDDSWFSPAARAVTHLAYLGRRFRQCFTQD